MRRFAVAIRLVTSAALAIFPVLRPCASPAQQSVHPLPQAIPGANYAAQLAIPPGLGYPFAKCELEGNAPRWLTLDCARLQLKGKVPAAATISAKDADLRVTLHLEDAAGNAREFPLSLRVSAEPQVVSLGEPPDGLLIPSGRAVLEQRPVASSSSDPNPTSKVQVSVASPQTHDKPSDSNGILSSKALGSEAALGIALDPPAPETSANIHPALFAGQPQTSADSQPLQDKTLDQVNDAVASAANEFSTAFAAATSIPKMPSLGGCGKKSPSAECLKARSDYQDALDKYQSLIDAAKHASSVLTTKSAKADPAHTTVEQQSTQQEQAQQLSDLACDLQANKDAYKKGNYTIPKALPYGGSSGACYQSSPYFRALLGGNYSAASSTDPQFKLVADLSIDVPVGSDKKSNGIPNSQYSWLWGYARIGSVSKQTSVIDPSQIVSDYASLSGAQPSQIVQSFEMNGGYAFQFLPWRGNLTYFDHGSFGLVAGGGALTPLSPSQSPPQTFTVPQATASANTSISYADGTAYVTFGSANCGGTPPLCYITYSPQERSRFYSFWEGGLRAKLYPAPEYLKANPFPAIFDVTFGQNEYVTGGHMKGGVIHFGGSTPISPIPGLYAFGAMDVGINNTADKPISAVLTPFTGTIPANIQAYQKVQPPLNRDRYSLGFGLDILQLLRTHQIQDAFNKKQ